MAQAHAVAITKPRTEITALQSSMTSNFLWTLAGNCVAAACQWATIIILAKLGTADLVGQFTLALAIALPIGLFANFQLRTVFVNDFEGEYTLGEIIGVRVLLCGIALVFVVILCRIATHPPYTTGLILAVTAGSLIDSLSESYYGICQRNDRMDRIARSIMLRGAGSLMAFASLVAVTGNILLGAAGSLIVKCVVLLSYDASFETLRIELANPRFRRAAGGQTLTERLFPTWALRKQAQLIWVALPLGGLSFLNSLHANIPRYVVERFLGPRELGIFAALSYVPQAALMIALALAFTAYARLAACYFDGDLAGFKSLVMRVSAICFGLGAGGFLITAVAGRQILRILYKPEYAERLGILLWLVAISAIACVVSCLGCALTATSRFHAQVPLALLITGVTAITSLVFVPRWGLYGAVFSGFVSMVLQLVGTLLLLHWALGKRSRESEPQVGLNGIKVGFASEQ